eukprot:191474-Pyramimonas_sp.AAC.1
MYECARRCVPQASACPDQTLRISGALGPSGLQEASAASLAPVGQAVPGRSQQVSCCLTRGGPPPGIAGPELEIL